MYVVQCRHTRGATALCVRSSVATYNIYIRCVVKRTKNSLLPSKRVLFTAANLPCSKNNDLTSVSVVAKQAELCVLYTPYVLQDVYRHVTTKQPSYSPLLLKRAVRAPRDGQLFLLL